LLKSIHFDGCVAVQARQSLEETEWLLDLAESHSFIKGVVGWVDLQSEKLREQLQRFLSRPKLVGVRHVVHDEPDDHFMLRPQFRHGIAQLREFGLTYDLLLFPKHLPVAAQLVEEFPQQPFVLDHIAKPGIAAGTISPWQDDLRRLAKFPNVFCNRGTMEAVAACGLSTILGRGRRGVCSQPPDDRFRLAGLHTFRRLRGRHEYRDRLCEAISAAHTNSHPG
jgi:L-fuconolactonase